MNVITYQKPMNRAEARRLWLAGLLAQRELGLLGRWLARAERRRAQWEAFRSRLPRPARRAVRAGLARGVAPALLAALLLGQGRATAQTGAIEVVNGEVAFADNGLCSLREAIANANSTSPAQMSDDCAPGRLGQDVISLPPGGRFDLTDHVGDVVYGMYTALPAITSHVTIEGNDATLRGRGHDTPYAIRLMAVEPTGFLELNDLNLMEGGGGVTNGINFGGAVLNRGVLHILGSSFRDNVAYYGGAVANFRRLSADGTLFERNGAREGGAIATPRLEGVEYEDPEVLLYNCRLNGNSALGVGGGLYSTIGRVRLTLSTVENNRAAGGGGLFAFVEELTVETSTISGNSVLYERYYGTGQGGGMWVGGTVAIINSTVSGNWASEFGGGIHNEGEMLVANSTITGNTANDVDGGGIINTGIGSLTLARSLISGNEAGHDGREIHNGNGNVVYADHDNLFGFDGDGGLSGFTPGPTDRVPPAGVGLSAILDPALAPNGGFSLTHALVAGSPAIDAAASDECPVGSLFGRDQRWAPRNIDGDGRPSEAECDIGAYEFQPRPPGWALVPIVLR